jgi:hypothetical protein
MTPDEWELVESPPADLPRLMPKFLADQLAQTIPEHRAAWRAAACFCAQNREGV